MKLSFGFSYGVKLLQSAIFSKNIVKMKTLLWANHVVILSLDSLGDQAVSTMLAIWGGPMNIIIIIYETYMYRLHALFLSGKADTCTKGVPNLKYVC